MDGSPFPQSFDGQRIPVLLTVKVIIGHVQQQVRGIGEAEQGFLGDVGAWSGQEAAQRRGAALGG